MTTKPETRLVARIFAAVRNRGAMAVKLHGSSYLKGFPDTLIVHPLVGVTFLEIKTPGNKPDKLQAAVLRKINKAGGRAYCVNNVAEALWLSCGVPIPGVHHGNACRPIAR